VPPWTRGRHTVDPVLTNFKSKYATDWSPFLGKKWTDNCDTAVPVTEWKRLAEKLTTLPKDFAAHPLVVKLYGDRAAMGRGEINVDWGMGENMAFATLVASGYPVRLSGEDCGRGTFTHRHSVLHDQNRTNWDEGTYIPLQNVAEGQAPFTVIDSILSEEAVLGFEYGYAAAEPNTLTIWEAQFGDFVNGAQVVIDQFLASGEVKWGRANGLTLMLPHGYEGQGPEHSSARLERFMQLAADNNMQIVQPTTAAQIFHVLRRQMLRVFRKPLVIMTPKSLLRAKDATSPLAEFTKGEFRTVIGDVDAGLNADKVKRLIVCSGKVVYDLHKKREEKKASDTAIIRVEQLYPVPAQGLRHRAEEVPQRHRHRLVPGRAAEPGLVVLRAALHPRKHAGRSEARLCRAPGQRLTGLRLRATAPGAAEGAARPGFRQAQGLRADQVSKGAPQGKPVPLRPLGWNTFREIMAIVDVKVPQLSESVAEATLLVNGRRSPVRRSRSMRILVEIETDKVVLEVPAPAGGVLAQIVKGDGENCVSDEVIARIDTEGKAGVSPLQVEQVVPASAAAAAAPAATAAPARAMWPCRPPPSSWPRRASRRPTWPAAARTDASPRAMRWRCLGAKPAAHVAAAVAVPAAPARGQAPAGRAAPAAMNLGDRPEQRVPMSRLRARVAERLLQSQSTNAILTTFNEVNMAPLMEMRKKFQDKFEKEHGVKLGFMSFFVKAAVAALKKFPVLNASVDGNDIVYHGYFDIGIAVGSPRGLVVPMMRNADQMSFADVEKKIAEFGAKARDGKLSMEDLSGGTFSISNGGTFGSMLSTPIINPPQSAILGVHATKDRAVVENGQIVIARSTTWR
jgi:2-oxoglutarate dehydrogenase complex dihydrolipoamide succinyltransferase (E2) component